MVSVSSYYQQMDLSDEQRNLLNQDGDKVRKLAVQIQMLRQKNPTDADSLIDDREPCPFSTRMDIIKHFKQYPNDKMGDYPGTDEKCVQSFNYIVANCRMSEENCKNLRDFIWERKDIVILPDNECVLYGLEGHFSVIVKSFDSNINPYAATDRNPIHEMVRKKILHYQMTARTDSVELLAISGTHWNALLDVIQNYDQVATINPPRPLERGRCCVIL